MSEKALEIYRQALSDQESRAQARRVRTLVQQARRSPNDAGVRWPFELLQNALDAGPRTGRSTVDVRFSFDSTAIRFQHDGAPFEFKELAALLSGGSSKELESDVTTGRFGTGFLVTHVLAERTRLRGLLLDVGTGHELFDVTLDRGGDEEAILTNIQQSGEAIASAVPVKEIEDTPSAVVEYRGGEDGISELGVRELRRALPYVYGTRTVLGHVELRIGPGEVERWDATGVEHRELDGAQVDTRTITLARAGHSVRVLRVCRFTTVESDSAAALVVIEQVPGGWRVCLPEPNAPRVFREYPLRNSGFVPINVVLDAKFDVEQERGGPSMGDDDKARLEHALSAAVTGVRHAVGQHWEDAHRLAMASCPSGAFHRSDTAAQAEEEWWVTSLCEFAQRLATSPIVACESEFLPAVGVNGGRFASFALPRLLLRGEGAETSIERLWPLMQAAKPFVPPCREVAPAWTEIAQGWRELGVPIKPVSVAKLSESVRAGATTFDQLQVAGDPLQWLCGFVDVVGECWESRDGVEPSALRGLLPNQHGRLCSPSELKRDRGVSATLKDVCAALECDLRTGLLLESIADATDGGAWAHLADTLHRAIPEAMTEDDAVARAVQQVQDTFPEGNSCDDLPLTVSRANVRLLHHLWSQKGAEAAEVARQLPFVVTDGVAVRWSSTAVFMAPVCSWPDSARSFASVYPPQRVLGDLYGGCETEECPDVVAPLVAWGIAHAEPIIITSPRDLTDKRLAELTTVDTDGVTLHPEGFSHVALLNDVLNRCSEREDYARALLGLVLCHVAKSDPAWKEVRLVTARRSRQEIRIPITPALWLADLKVRAWVPMLGEDDERQKVVANATTLKDLLDASWLEENDDAVRLLSDWFEFDKLELRLMSSARDDSERAELRDRLAALVETGGANPGFYAELVEEIEARQRRKRDVSRHRQLGLAVQDAVRASLEGYNLDVTLVDRGFDYEVAIKSDDAVHDAHFTFELGRFLVEVKATTTGNARLTPLQAKTAAAEQPRYVLCVVDLRGLANDELDRDWTGDRVEALAKLVPDIGAKVGETREWVEAARTNEVGIRNESALRYEVPPDTWDSGVTIDAWVKSVRRSLVEDSESTKSSEGVSGS